MGQAHSHYWYHCENECGRDTHDLGSHTISGAKNKAQTYGWHIGKIVLCPCCLEQLGKKPKGYADEFKNLGIR